MASLGLKLKMIRLLLRKVDKKLGTDYLARFDSCYSSNDVEGVNGVLSEVKLALGLEVSNQ